MRPGSVAAVIVLTGAWEAWVAAACGGHGPGRDAAAGAARGLADAGVPVEAPAPVPPRARVMEALPDAVPHAVLTASRPAARILATGRAGVTGVAFAAEAVVFTEADAGRVVRVPLAGGLAEVIADRLPTPTGVAVLGPDVYVVARGVGPAAGDDAGRALEGGLWRVPPGGLAERVVRLDEPVAVVAAAGALYVVLARGGGIVRVVLGALGAAATVTPWEQPPAGVAALAAGSDRLIWADAGELGVARSRRFAGEGAVAPRFSLGAVTGLAVRAHGIVWLEGAAGRAHLQEGEVRTPFFALPQPLTAVAARGDDVIVATADVVWWLPAVRTPVVQRLEVIGAAPGQPRSVAVRGDDVVWTTYGGGVFRAPRDGGAPVLLAHVPRGLAAGDADATHVYWVNFDSGEVARVARAGGAVEAVAADPGRPVDVAVRGGVVYWVSGDRLRAAPADGGARAPARELAVLPGVAHGLDLDAAGEVAWVAVAVPGAGDALVRVELASGRLVTLVSGAAGLDDVAVAGDDVVWIAEDPRAAFANQLGEVWRVDRRVGGVGGVDGVGGVGGMGGVGGVGGVGGSGGSGGSGGAAAPGPVRLASSLSMPGALAVAEGHAWFVLADGAVGRVPVAGGSLEIVVGGGRNVNALAVDDGRVVLASGGTLEGHWTDGAILRVKAPRRP